MALVPTRSGQRPRYLVSGKSPRLHEDFYGSIEAIVESTNAGYLTKDEGQQLLRELFGLMISREVSDMVAVCLEPRTPGRQIGRPRLTQNHALSNMQGGTK